MIIHYQSLGDGVAGILLCRAARSSADEKRQADEGIDAQYRTIKQVPGSGVADVGDNRY
jgi:hypothetical protein